MANVLIVVTSHTQLGNTGRPTGFYFDEMATPYYAFRDAGHDVDIASIRGGAAAHDPNSLSADESKLPAAVRRFLADAEAMAKLKATISIDDANPDDYDAIFLPGGHGAMWDFPFNTALSRAVGAIYDAGGHVGAVCHGPAGLVGARRGDGKPLVQGLRVNSFTDAEEAAIRLTHEMPFLLETRLTELGGRFEGGDNFTAKAVRDGRLVTGQNPMSVEVVSALMVETLGELGAARARA